MRTSPRAGQIRFHFIPLSDYWAVLNSPVIETVGDQRHVQVTTISHLQVYKHPFSALRPLSNLLGYLFAMGPTFTTRSVSEGGTRRSGLFLANASG